MNDNPLTLTYTALWTMIEAYPNLDDLVRIGNRIRFDSETDRSPQKNRVQAADLPELTLITNGGTPNLCETSSSSKFIRRYSWWISTGDNRLNEKLYQVEWAVLVAMTNWKQVLTALQWKGKSFVKRTAVTDISEGMSNPQLNRNIKGWSSLWTCEVEMHFKTSDLLDELTP